MRGQDYLLMLFRPLLLFCSLLPFAACDISSTLGSDFGVVLPGCYGPNSCWNVHCNCNFASVGDCKLCDPASAPANVCECSNFGDAGLTAVCEEQADVCVGRAPNACNGLCVHAGGNCATSDKEPPDEVASVIGDDGGPATEKRCSYSDDICCL